MTDSQRRRIFNENFEEINRVVESKRHKWGLKAISWMDFEDVKQIIFLHIFNKLHKWSIEKGSIGQWVNRLSSNQIYNILRNNYYNFARPCLNCEFNTSKNNKGLVVNSEDNFCALTESGVQCEECPMYAKWLKSKKQAFNIKLPLPIETQEVETPKKGDNFFNYENAEEKLHKRMELALTIKDFRCYKLLFINKMPDEEVAKKLGYITNEKNRTAGYNTLKKMKKIFAEKAKEIIQSEDIVD